MAKVIIWWNTCEPGHEKMCLVSYANNKGTDQPAHPRSPISAFVVHCLDSIISLDSIAEISRLQLASIAEQASLSLTWSETPEDTFCRVMAHVVSVFTIHCSPDSVIVLVLSSNFMSDENLWRKLKLPKSKKAESLTSIDWVRAGRIARSFFFSLRVFWLTLIKWNLSKKK